MSLVQRRRHRSASNPEHVGDRGVVEVGVIAQKESEALPLGQASEMLTDLRRVGRSFGSSSIAEPGPAQALPERRPRRARRFPLLPSPHARVPDDEADRDSRPRPEWRLLARLWPSLRPQPYDTTPGAPCLASHRAFAVRRRPPPGPHRRGALASFYRRSSIT